MLLCASWLNNCISPLRVDSSMTVVMTGRRCSIAELPVTKVVGCDSVSDGDGAAVTADRELQVTPCAGPSSTGEAMNRTSVQICVRPPDSQLLIRLAMRLWCEGNVTKSMNRRS